MNERSGNWVSGRVSNTANDCLKVQDRVSMAMYGEAREAR